MNKQRKNLLIRIRESHVVALLSTLGFLFVASHAGSSYTAKSRRGHAILTLRSCGAEIDLLEDANNTSFANPLRFAVRTWQRFANRQPATKSDDYDYIDNSCYLNALTERADLRPSVSFSRTVITTDMLRAISQIDELSCVYFDDCTFNSDLWVHLPRRIEEVHVSGLSVANGDAVAIKQHSAFRSLEFSDCQISGLSMEIIATLPNIRQLIFKNCATDDTIVAHLAKSTTLVDLTLAGICVQKNELSRLADVPTLRSLTLVGPWLSDDQFFAACCLPQIDRLVLEQSRVSSNAIRRAQNVRPDLEIRDHTELSE